MLTHEASRVGDISSDLVVDLDEPFPQDGLDFTAVECVFQAIAEEDYKREGFAELVRTRGGARGL